MPFYTDKFKLPFFSRGETYSASRDRQRFEMIDEELSAISSLIGTGVINGMAVSSYSQDTISVSEGVFCIQGRMYVNAISQNIYIDSKGVSYVWASTGTSSGVIYGNVSNITELNYIDSSAGSPVSSVNFESISPYAVKVKVSSALPADIKRINVFRSLENLFSSSSQIAVINAPDLLYEDDSLTPGNTYYYWMINEDINGLESEVSDAFAYVSPMDMSIPDAPNGVKLYPAHRSIEVVWNAASSKNVSNYLIRCSQGDQLFEDVVPNTVTNTIFINLKNGIPAVISIIAVSYADLESETVSITGSPAFNPAARDADSIIGSFYPSASDGGVRASIRIVWENPTINPNASDLSIGEQKELSGQYDIATKYQVWEIRQNGSVSIQGEKVIAYTANEIIFSYFPKKSANNQIVNESLKDNTNYLVKLTRTIDGMESVGRYVNVRTGDVTPPSAATGMFAELQPDGSLDLTWSVSDISQIAKQKISISSAPILSTSYNYASAASIGVKFAYKNSSATNIALFGENPPFKIGYIDGFFIFEIDSDRIQAIKDAGTISGFGEILNIEVLSPPDGIYISTVGLSFADFKSNFIALSPVLRCTVSPNGGLAKGLLVSIADMVDIVNLTGKDDKDYHFDKIIKSEPTNFIPDTSYINAPFCVSFWSLSDGFTFDQIPKTVLIGNFTLDINDDLGQNTSYILSSSLVYPNRRYLFSIKLYDYANNVSETSTLTYDTEPLWSITPPSPPSLQLASVEDDLVKVSWLPSYDVSVSGYRILRTEINDNGLISAADESSLRWIEIGVVGRSTHEYVDYSAVPELYYIYRVISVGILGKSSPAFFSLNENNETTNIKQAPSLDTGSFVPSITISQEGNDAIIVFSNTSGDYDGYHIYRSFNMGLFEKIASIKSGGYSFTDSGALIKSGSYRYLVRPVTTQASIVVTSDPSYSNGVLLAEIVASVDGIQINDLSESVLLAAASVNPELGDRISSHRHLYLDSETDARISLGSEYVFDNFETDNNQRFFVNDLIPSLPPDYSVSVFLNNEISNINFEFLPTRQLLKFSTKLAPNSGDNQTVEPFSSLPDIKLVVNVGGETLGDLFQDRLSSIFAQQVGFGKLLSKTVPVLSHAGVHGESMRALDCIAESIDGFKFIVTMNENRNHLVYNQNTSVVTEISEFEYNDLELSDGIMSKVGFPLNKTRHYIVHDSFNIPGTENFIFATSRGVYYYWQNGAVFNMDLLISSEPPQDSGPCYKLIYLQDSRIILCLNFRSFDILKVSANGGVAVMQAQQGLDFNAHVFRDAVECSDGSIFISSDIGLFRMKSSSFVNYQNDDRNSSGNVSNIKIEQVGLFSGTSTDVYALWTNADKNSVYASTEFGVFRSTNFGQSFSIVRNLIKTPALWQVVNYQGTWFAVSENSIYRKRENEISFTRIFYDDSFIFRKLMVKYGKIILVTNDGLYVTESIVNCKYADSVLIKPVDVETAENGRRKVVYAVSSFGPYLIASLEGKTKLMYSIDRFAEHVDFSSSITLYGVDDFPSVSISNKNIGIGVYFQYTSDGKKDDCIFFDKFVPESNVVKVARQYKKFALPSGGWARRDFAAPCILYKNNAKLNDGSRADKPFNQIAYYSDLQHSLTDQVSNIVEMESNLTGLRSHASIMLTNTIDTDGNPTEFGIHRFTRNNVKLLIDKIDQVNSKIYDDNDVSQMGILSSLRVPYIIINVDFIANSLPEPYVVSKEMLNKMGIAYQAYSEPLYEGLLGTYDPEDPTYYLPDIPTKPLIDGVRAPNYEFTDTDAFTDDINVIYSGYYGDNNGESALNGYGVGYMQGVNNNNNDGTIDQGPGPDGAIGPGGSGGLA